MDFVCSTFSPQIPRSTLLSSFGFPTTSIVTVTFNRFSCRYYFCNHRTMCYRNLFHAFGFFTLLGTTFHCCICLWHHVRYIILINVPQKWFKCGPLWTSSLYHHPVTGNTVPIPERIVFREIAPSYMLWVSLEILFEQCIIYSILY